MKPIFLFSLFPFFFSPIVLITSCKKDAPLIDTKEAYYPTNIGHYVIYEVDSITYDNFFIPIKIDTVSFEIRELIESTFLDNNGNTTQRLERYRRNNDTLPWTLIDVWQVNKYDNKVEKVEDNLRYIKLTLPPLLNKRWEGNSFIDATGTLGFLSNWSYVYTELDVSKSINGMNFDSTLTVEGIDFENLIEKIAKTETYAKNVGLVKMEYTYLETQIISNQAWEVKAEKGFIISMRIKTWGNL